VRAAQAGIRHESGVTEVLARTRSIVSIWVTGPSCRTCTEG
jgi:hypothetical protein